MKAPILSLKKYEVTLIGGAKEVIESYSYSVSQNKSYSTGYEDEHVTTVAGFLYFSNRMNHFSPN